jgi:hypothetical protein
VLRSLLAELAPLALGPPAVGVCPCYQAAGWLKGRLLVPYPLHLEGAGLCSEAMNLCSGCKEESTRVFDQLQNEFGCGAQPLQVLHVQLLSVLALLTLHQRDEVTSPP